MNEDGFWNVKDPRQENLNRYKYEYSIPDFVYQIALIRTFHTSFLTAKETLWIHKWKNNPTIFFKAFLLLPFFKRPLFKIQSRISKWGRVSLFQYGITLFWNGTLYFRIPKIEPLLPSRIAAYLKWKKFGGVRFRI